MKKIIISLFVVCLLGTVYFLYVKPSTGESTVIKRYEAGFLEVKESGLRVLHLKGTAYERGYQRGMLQDDLDTLTLDNITALSAWLAGDNLEAGLTALRDAKKIMAPFIPYQFRQEMKGMADALKDRGSQVTYDDILLHLVGAELGMMDTGHNLDRPRSRNTYPPITRCSSFTAWGGATKDGKLLPPTEASGWDDYPIMVCRPDWVMAANIKYYKRAKQGEFIVKSGNVSSYIALPACGEIRWAVGVPPAAYTAGYTRMNLHEELAKTR